VAWGDESFGTLDQSDWQAEFAAELSLAAGHLAVVAFVIVAAQMENPMQDKDFNFYAGVVPESTRILGGDFGGDGDVAGQFLIGIRRGWK
jgi:hypothetical protein